MDARFFLLATRGSVLRLGLLVLAVTCCGAHAETRILLVATPPDHPHGSHMYEFDCGTLAACLNQTDGVQATQTLNWPPDPKLLEGVKSIVFYSSPVGEKVLHPDHRAQFLKLMNDGVGLVAIHWSTGVGYSPLADDPALREQFAQVLGGWFRRPPGRVAFDAPLLVQVDPQHAACRGWTPFKLKDEYYLDLVFHPQAHPILQVQIDGQDHTVAWSLERSGGGISRSRIRENLDSETSSPIRGDSNRNPGRSFATVLGHYHDNFTNPDFRRFLVNGILWTAHIDVPAEGAPVAVADEALRLPEPGNP